MQKFSDNPIRLFLYGNEIFHFARIVKSSYNKVIVIIVPLPVHMLHCKRCCGLVMSLLPQDDSRKAPTMVLYSIVN